MSHECVRAHVCIVPKLLIGVSFNQTIIICVMCHGVFMFLTWSCQQLMYQRKLASSFWSLAQTAWEPVCINSMGTGLHKQHGNQFSMSNSWLYLMQSESIKLLKSESKTCGFILQSALLVPLRVWLSLVIP